MMKEYYPQDYDKLKELRRRRPVVSRRQSSVDEGDANVPSAESLVRHVLYGNRFFEREFGEAQPRVHAPGLLRLPGRPAVGRPEPTAASKGFSTQKLTWGSANGIPFKVGVWSGPDGGSVIAALDPGAYTGRVREDLSQSQSWLTRIDNTGKQSGFFGDYHYFGTGDKRRRARRAVGRLRDEKHGRRRPAPRSSPARPTRCSTP